MAGLPGSVHDVQYAEQHNVAAFDNPAETSRSSSRPRASQENSIPKQTRSCTECRRRKIKCNGATSPCDQCTRYRIPDKCYYANRRQRQATSNKSFNEVSAALARANGVLAKLFPSTSVDTLSGYTREDLFDLLNITSGHTITLHQDDQEQALQELAPTPQQGFVWDESANDSNLKVNDDVNGLSLSTDSNSSYLGISSVSAILRVIVKLVPTARPRMLRHESQTNPHAEIRIVHPSTLPSEATLIDAYFDSIHYITPMIDEVYFREKYARGDDTSSSWLALLNMVLSMGSLATRTPDERSHAVFYERAHRHMSLDSFGAGSLEIIQALGILGGYYCHKVNKPNQANVVMGAALRMAIAMGLHLQQDGRFSGPQVKRFHEVRRRIWWSLFCLDTWASFTLGRPSLGRWDPATITAELPSKMREDDFAGASLAAGVQFCKIGTAIQDRFARSSLLSLQEMDAFDEKLLAWQDNLPLFMKELHRCPYNLRVAQGSIMMQYHNLRLVLHRPRLLICSLHQRSRAARSVEDRQVIRKCRLIASMAIEFIDRCWFLNQFSIRDSAWFLLQATMIPLLSLAAEPDNEERPMWQKDVEITLRILETTSTWSSTVKKTYEVVSSIYEAISSASSLSSLDPSIDMVWDPGMGTLWEDIDWESVLHFNSISSDATGFEPFGYNSVQ